MRLKKDCNGEIPIIYNSVLNGARDERTKARDKREFAFWEKGRVTYVALSIKYNY